MGAWYKVHNSAVCRCRKPHSGKLPWPGEERKSNFQATERLKCQLRGDFYHFLNHHNMYVAPFNANSAELENFNPSAGDPKGGNSQGIEGLPGGYPSANHEPRQMQLALKFQF